MFITRKHILMIALAMLPSITGAQTPQAAASAGPKSQATPAAQMVTFVLVPSLDPDTVGAIILRRAVRAPQNVILVSAATTPADLVEALVMLDRSRRSRGDSLTLDMKALTRHGNDAIARGTRLYQPAVQNLERLKIANPRRVDGVGTFPAVTMVLAPVRRGAR